MSIPLLITSGIVGVAAVSMGALALAKPDGKFAQSKVFFPVLAGTSVLTLVLIILNIVKRGQSSQTTTPQVPSTTKPQPPTTTTTPPPADFYGTTQPITQAEFDEWLKQYDPSLAQQIPPQQTLPPITITKPAPKPTTPPSTTTPTPISPTPISPTPTTPTPTSPTPSSNNSSGYSAAEIQQWLDAHNSRRAKYGLSPLTWDDSLSVKAKVLAVENANAGRMQHSNGGRGNGVDSENIYWSMSGRGAPRVTPEEVLQGWYNSEIISYDYNTNTCAPGKVCGHVSLICYSIICHSMLKLN